MEQQRLQRGLPLDKNPLSLRRSMALIDEWLSANYGAIHDSSPKKRLSWKDWDPSKGNPPLFNWLEALERCGGIGPNRLITYDQILDPRFSRSGAYEWFIEGHQQDYSYYSDPTYVYLALFSYAIVSERTIATEGWDIAKDGLMDQCPIFLAGGTIWEASNLIRRGAKRVVLSNYETPQISFYRFVADQLGYTDSGRIAFVDQNEVPRSNDILIVNEYFEHFVEPIKELDRLMINSPLRMYHRSGFNLVGHGHPIPLTLHGKQVSDHFEADRIFDDYLKSFAAYEFSRVTGGWRDSTRRLSQQTV